MLIYIKRQDFNGPPLFLNGKPLAITPDQNIDVPSEYLDILTRAGIPYRAALTGALTGKIILENTPTGTRWLWINGKPVALPTGVAIEASDEVRAILTRAGIIYSLEIGEAPSGGATYSQPDKYFAGSIGLRWPNKSMTLTGTSGSTRTKYANYIVRKSAPWDVPAGSSVVMALPAIYVLEDPESSNPETRIASDVTVTDCYLQYTDDGGTVRNVACTMSNGGVLSAAGSNGGILATTLALPADIPAWSDIKIGIGLSLTAGSLMIACYDARIGTDEGGRSHDTTGFTAQLATGASLSGNSGSTSSAIGGFLYGPAAIFYKGADGRPVFFADGDSIGYGKGTPGSVAVDGIAGIIELMCANDVGTYRIPVINTCIAASRPQYTHPDDEDYNPTIAQYARELVDQVTVLNGGVAPFSHFTCEHGNNSVGNPYNTLFTFTPMMQSRWAFLQAWHDKPIIQATMIQRTTSTDMFQSSTGQAPSANDQTSGVRFQWNDSILGESPPEGFDYAVNTYAALAFDTGSNRDKFKVAPFSTTIAAGDAGSGSTLVLTHAPTPGMCLALAGQARIVEAVTGAGPYSCTTTAGASSGVYGSRTAGDAVYQIYTSDGQPALTGLHLSQPANQLVAPQMDALKAILRGAPGGWG